MGLVERLEQHLLLARGYAQAGVGDTPFKHGAAVRLASPDQVNPHPAGLGELDGVADQVVQHLLDTQGVAVRIDRNVGGDGGEELQALGVGGGRVCLHYLFGERGRIQALVLSVICRDSILETSRISLITLSRPADEVCMVRR